MKSLLHLSCTLALALAAAIAGSALAAEPEKAAERKPADDDIVALALKVGGEFHSAFSGLSSTIGGEFEVGVLLLANRLEFDFALSYARPPASLSGSDPRLAAGRFSWELDQDLFILGLLARWRFITFAGFFTLYAAAGPRLYLMSTTVTGKSGNEAFGENGQTDTKVGLLFAPGGEFTLGPGAMLIEVPIGVADLDGAVTGEANSSAIGAMLGYRFML